MAPWHLPGATLRLPCEGLLVSLWRIIVSSAGTGWPTLWSMTGWICRSPHTIPTGMHPCLAPSTHDSRSHSAVPTVHASGGSGLCRSQPGWHDMTCGPCTLVGMTCGPYTGSSWYEPHAPPGLRLKGASQSTSGHTTRCSSKTRRTLLVMHGVLSVSWGCFRVQHGCDGVVHAGVPLSCGPHCAYLWVRYTGDHAVPCSAMQCHAMSCDAMPSMPMRCSGDNAEMSWS